MKKILNGSKIIFKPFRVFNGTFFMVVFCALILTLGIRGIPGNPTATSLNQNQWKDYGPLELSPERGRYALLYSIVEDKSFKFSVDLARFVMPDVAYTNGHYASLFAPSVSIISLPGYVIGRYFGLAQVGSFVVVAVFALLNFWLIRLIAMRLGATATAASLGGLIFIFATPAFSYAVTLYQHHITTFLILLSIYLLMRFNNILSLFVIWIIIAFSVTVDYPNFFMLLPIGLFAFGRIFHIEKYRDQIKVHVKLFKFLTIAGVIFPLLFFLWFNKQSYDNPFQLSGALQRTINIDSKGKPVEPKRANVNNKEDKSIDTSNSVALVFFNNRNITNGMYIFFLSPDRGMLVFTPIILFGFPGLILALRKKVKYTTLLFAILGINILIYSMWGDPYGGWAFGSRYLIPGYAILAIFISLLLTYRRHDLLLLILFYIILSYSFAVNTLGAITSNKNPPKIEAVAMERQFHTPQPYTYERNKLMLDSNSTKSFVYSTYLRSYMNAWEYYSMIISFLIVISGILLIFYWSKTDNKNINFS